MTRRGWWWGALIALPLLLVVVADPLLAALGGSPFAVRAVVDVSESTAPALAALVLAIRARRTWREQRDAATRPDGTGSAVIGWSLLAGACASWAFGQLVWSWYEIVAKVEVPAPSLADVGYLGFAALAPAATALVTRGSLRPLSRWRAVLDGVIVSLALTVISWLLILGPMLADGASTPFDLALNAAYPLGDVIVLSVVVVVMSRTRASVGLLLLTGGAGLMALSDSAFVYTATAGTFATGGLIDAGWTGAFVALAVAGRVGLAPAAAGRDGGRFDVALPYVPLLVAGALLAHRELAGALDDASVIGGVVLISVVLGRQGILVVENNALLQQLHEHTRTLRAMAYTDPLTGIANRLAFTEHLEALVASREPFTVAFCDLDEFKAVNDRCGHAVGDALLIAVATRLTTAVRDGDLVARLGGDEFAVLTTGPRGDGGATLLARLTDALETPPLSHDPAILAVTSDPAVAALVDRVSASTGVVDSDEVPLTEVESVLHEADHRMYAAKRARSAVPSSAA